MVAQLSCHNRSNPPRGCQRANSAPGSEGVRGHRRESWRDQAGSAVRRPKGRALQAGTRQWPQLRLWRPCRCSLPTGVPGCVRSPPRDQRAEPGSPDPKGVHPCPSRCSRYQNASSDGKTPWSWLLRLGTKTGKWDASPACTPFQTPVNAPSPWPLVLRPPAEQKLPRAPERLIYHSRGDPNDNAACPRPAVNCAPHPTPAPSALRPLPLHTLARKEARCNSPGMSKQEKRPDA